MLSLAIHVRNMLSLSGMGELVYLADHRVSKETVEVLDSLRSDAQRGRVVGLAYVAILDDGTFEADTSGAAAQSPVLTIGMLHILQRRLEQH